MKTMDENWEYEPAICGVTIDDYRRSIELINKFFDDNISRCSVDKWDTCITIIRKGRAIFKEQTIRNKNLYKLNIISNGEISINSEIITNKNVLIFDDSIKSGKTIIGVLDLVLAHNPRKVTVSAIIALDETIKKLKNMYSGKIEFNIFKILPFSLSDTSFNIKYKKEHERLIDTYIECTCRPLQNDDIHPYLAIRLKENYKNNFFDVFGQHSHKFISDNDLCLSGLKNRFKKSFDFNKKYKERINHYIKIKNASSEEDLALDPASIVTIRIFYRADLNEILLLPIIQNHENCHQMNGESFEQRDYMIKTYILFFLLDEYVICNLKNLNIKDISLHLNKK